MITHQSISYTITKTGSNTYELKWIINDTESGIKQKSAVNLVKEDADGTKTTQSIEIMPSSIVRWNPDIPSSSTSNVFFSNLTTSNLAPGGICFDVNEVSTNVSPLNGPE